MCRSDHWPFNLCRNRQSFRLIFNQQNFKNMKTQTSNKLAFAKSSLVELNDNQLNDVNGGTTPVCVGVIIGLSIYVAIDKALD
ncbi:class IIb bacteriocin, lactobin A/cerein 7B family [Flavobacterium supellecticarium]|uniref:Class IIb bacteriocin, lactobin A/cerein 7B family n=2 Tax=Flavobacterium supellecticarium TaxID=2565924 RepID=A0A4S3ZUT5_9FLAO|nr:class IIb bacteriocin, lactobin A/cerein 7B family [Flavobacterium supellecticarium]